FCNGDDVTDFLHILAFVVGNYACSMVPPEFGRRLVPGVGIGAGLGLEGGDGIGVDLAAQTASPSAAATRVVAISRVRRLNRISLPRIRMGVAASTTHANTVAQ